MTILYIALAWLLSSIIVTAIFCRSIHKAKVRSGEIWYA